jgi:hypothetical protein
MIGRDTFEAENIAPHGGQSWRIEVFAAISRSSKMNGPSKLFEYASAPAAAITRTPAHRGQLEPSILSFGEGAFASGAGFAFWFTARVYFPLYRFATVYWKGISAFIRFHPRPDLETL